jgi:signal transduction histidine kinase
VKKGGRIGHRVPTYVFVGLMTLALAQSTWWVIYQVGESARTRDLELKILEERARLAERDLQAVGRPLDADEQTVFLRRFPGLALMATDSSATGLSPVVGSERLRQAWSEAARRTRMFVLEGAFFTLLIMLAVRYQLKAQRSLGDAVRQQSNFISGVTHELKSPLTSIRLYAELLENPDIKPEARLRGAAVIREEADRLSALVEQILRARALDAREMRLELRPLELQAWLQDRAVAIEGRLRVHERQLERSGAALPESLGPFWVLADEEALDLVIGNLVDNAIKYSPRPSRISLGLERQGPWAELWVADEGVGFEPQESRRLFDRFYRGGSEMTRRAKGTGLGLYLVREFAEAMNGRVLAESDGPGRGARFAVLLPLHPNGKV